MAMRILTAFLPRRKAFLLAVLLTALTSAHAEEPADIGTIEVKEQKERKETPSLDEAAAATVIVPEETPDPTATVPMLLEQSAGVTVKRYGGLDDFSAISLRGSTAGQVGIYLDDIPLATAQGQITDLSVIPTDAIDKIEVYRGGAPGMMPDSSAGGVVVLKSKPMPKEPSSDLKFSYGSFNSFNTRINVEGPHGCKSKPIDKVGFRLSYEFDRSSGDFTYLDNNGTTANPNDDRIIKRQNNDHATNTAYGSVGIRLPKDSTLTVNDIFFRKNQGVPGLATNLSLNARLTSWRNLTWAAYSAPQLISSTSGISATVFVDWFRSEFEDPFGEIGLGRQDNDDNTVRVGDQFKISAALGRYQVLKGILAHSSEIYMPEDKLSSPSRGPNSWRHRISAGAEDEILLLDERLIITPTARLETIFNHMTSDNPSIATATLQTNRKTDMQPSGKLGIIGKPVQGLKLRANVYYGYRPPTFSELFGDRGSIVGNADLQAERALNMDVGLSYEFPSASFIEGGYVEAFYFRNGVDHLIQFIQTSQFTAMAMNMNKALIQGAEFTGVIELPMGFHERVAYTFQIAKDTSGQPATDGKYLPGRPIHQLNAGSSWKRRWNDIIESEFFGTFDYMSGNYLDTQNLLKVENRTIFGAGVTLTFVDRVGATFSVRNITNDRISDLVGYPLPGRSYWGNISVNI